MVRVLLVDDEALTREILRDYLRSDPRIDIVGEASSGSIAVTQTAALDPEVILMDMQMPGMDGVAATAAIHETWPHVAILGLSSFVTDRYVVDVLRAGASGYLAKSTPPEVLIDAVHAASAGESVLSPQVVSHVVKGLATSVPAQRTPDPRLTSLLSEKEREVIALLARGLSNREIADALFVTESAVKARFVSVMAKLGVRDRVQILVTAVSCGLVDPQHESPPPNARDLPFRIGVRRNHRD